MKQLGAIKALADSFGKLPGVGVKTAERMAYAVLSFSEEDRDEFIEALRNVAEKIRRCPICGLYTEEERCSVCADSDRDPRVICVVAEAKDALSIEKMNSFRGVYHVLGGTINVGKGGGSENLSIDALLNRVEETGAEEVILAMNSTLDGETTSLFIAKLLEGRVAVTRLGYGLPMGASLDYADALTLSKAFEGRKKI